MSERNIDQVKALCRRIHGEHDPEIFDQLLMELRELLEVSGQSEASLRRMFYSQSRSTFPQSTSGNDFSKLLESAIAATNADYGNVQAYDPAQRSLRIVAQWGFNDEFLDYFARVTLDDRCACGAAMRSSARVIVCDTAIDPVFSEQERRVLLEADVRSVQSTPMLDRLGRLIGVVSTHYRQPHGYDAGMGWVLDQSIAGFFEPRRYS